MHMHQDDVRLMEAERLFQADQGMSAAKILLEIIQEDPKFIAAHSLVIRSVHSTWRCDTSD